MTATILVVLTLMPGDALGQFAGESQLSLDLWPAAGDDDQYEQHSLNKQLSGTVYRKLEETTSCEFVDAPLSEVIEFFRLRHELPIFLDRSELDDAGLGVELPVTGRSDDLRLRTTLDMLFRGPDLAWLVGDGYLLVTTAEAAEVCTETHVYPVLDLVHTAQGNDYDTLINLILGHVEPTSWPIGGESMDVFAGNLVIPQEQRTHEQIGDLLAMLRLALRQSTGDGVYAVVTRNDARRSKASAGERAEQLASEHIHQKLSEPVTCDFDDAKLSAVVELLRDKHGIQIQFDGREWYGEDPPLDAPITFRCESIPLQSAMHLIFRPLGIDWSIGDGYLSLTSQETAEDLVETRVYPVGDLLAGDGPGPGDVDQLRTSLATAVVPESWGGVGSISTLDKLIVVTQTQPAHRQIEKLLADLRAATNGSADR